MHCGRRVCAAVLLAAAMMGSQSRGEGREDWQDWQAAAGGKMAFEVASVKADSGPFRPPNFPLDNGNAFAPGGRFSADFGVVAYVQFAYKVRISRQQLDAMTARGHLPKWIENDRFAIEAKAAGSASKDQMRLMMQSLLAERFHLAVHYETQETAVMALRMVKAGKMGPNLRPHSEDPPCEATADATAQGARGTRSGALSGPVLGAANDHAGRTILGGVAEYHDGPVGGGSTGDGAGASGSAGGG